MMLRDALTPFGGPLQHVAISLSYLGRKLLGRYHSSSDNHIFMHLNALVGKTSPMLLEALKDYANFGTTIAGSHDKSVKMDV